MQNVPLP